MITLTPADLAAEITAVRAAIVAYIATAPFGAAKTAEFNLSALQKLQPIPVASGVSTATKDVSVLSDGVNYVTAGTPAADLFLTKIRWRYHSLLNNEFDRLEHIYAFTRAELTT